MSWVAVAVGGGAILGLAGGVMGADASRSAANTQADATRNATAVENQQFNQTQTNLAPWLQSGQTSLAELSQQFGGAGSPGNTPFGLQQFQASPAYKFNLDQGMQAINKGANARGNFYAPQTLQDLSKFAQGTASNEFQNAFSNYNTQNNNLFTRLQNLSGSGQNAAAQLGGFGAGVAGQVGSNMIGAGNAQAAGIVGQANAIGGAGAGVYNAAIMQQILGQQQNGLYNTGGGAGTGGMQGLNANTNQLFGPTQ